MGVIVNKKEENDEFSQIIQSDIKEKKVQHSKNADVDIADEAEKLNDLKNTRRYGCI